jgi:hypothetical protein
MKNLYDFIEKLDAFLLDALLNDDIVLNFYNTKDDIDPVSRDHDFEGSIST